MARAKVLGAGGGLCDRSDAPEMRRAAQKRQLRRHAGRYQMHRHRFTLDPSYDEHSRLLTEDDELC